MKGGGEGGGITDRKAALQLKHKTIHPSAKGKINNPTNKPRTFKITQIHQQTCPFSYVGTLQLLLIFVLVRNTLEGYEPDGAGVKHSQNNCCDESAAIVSTLDIWCATRKYRNCDDKFTSLKNTA